jgi:hypothetical protein
LQSYYLSIKNHYRDIFHFKIQNTNWNLNFEIFFGTAQSWRFTFEETSAESSASLFAYVHVVAFQVHINLSHSLFLQPISLTFHHDFVFSLAPTSFVTQQDLHSPSRLAPWKLQRQPKPKSLRLQPQWL